MGWRWLEGNEWKVAARALSVSPALSLGLVRRGVRWRAGRSGSTPSRPRVKPGDAEGRGVDLDYFWVAFRPLRIVSKVSWKRQPVFSGTYRNIREMFPSALRLGV